MELSPKLHQRTIRGTSPVFNAIHDNDLNVISVIDALLLATRASINDKIDTLNNTALHFATIKDRIHIVKHILSKSADVNAKNDDGETPLHIAIKTNNIPIAKVLLDNKSDLDQTNEFGLTAFMLSIQFSCKEMIEFLIDYGVDIHKCVKLTGLDNANLRPLDFAVRLLRVEVVEFLISRGADVNQFVGESMITPLHALSMRLLGMPFNKNLDKLKADRIAELLIKAGADLNSTNQSVSTPILLAIKAKDFNLVELFVKSGCDLSIPLSPENSSRTPLQLIVIVSGKKKLVELLLRYGANYNQSDDDTGFTAYHWSLQDLPFYNFPNVQIFWQYGCPYDLPLFPYTNKCKLYLTSNTDNRIKDIVQCQKLMFEGIKSNNVNTVEKALTLGAVVRGTSMEIKYPLHFVSSRGFTHVAKLLLEKGIKVNNLNNEYESALQLAINERKISMCKLLFQHGAYLNYKVEIRKLANSDDESGKEIQNLLMSIFSWFSLIKQGNPIILELLKDMLETDEELFLVHLNALDKNKNSIMASAMSYGNTEIVEGIMKQRLCYKQKFLGLKLHQSL